MESRAFNELKPPSPHDLLLSFTQNIQNNFMEKCNANKAKFPKYFTKKWI